jgi:hypothetical protein
MSEIPYYEGKTLEYKKSVKDKFKIEATVCAFLNTEGGHLICGIHDSRKLNWMDMSEKEIDLFLGKIDSIISNRTVRYQNGDPLHYDAITTRVVRNSLNQCIIIISSFRKEGTLCTYQGNIIYRLNVSNFYSTSMMSYTSSEMDLVKKQIESKMTHEFGIEMKKCRKYMRKLEKTNILLEKACMKINADKVSFKDLLHERILKEKREAERIIENSKKCSFLSIFCCIF